MSGVDEDNFSSVKCAFTIQYIAKEKMWCVPYITFCSFEENSKKVQLYVFSYHSRNAFNGQVNIETITVHKRVILSENYFIVFYWLVNIEIVRPDPLY